MKEKSRMNLLGIDVETTGLNPKEDRVIEVGAVLWNVERGTPIDLFSALVSHDGVEISESITKLTGITNGDLADHGDTIGNVLNRVYGMATHADHYVAHNAEFDRSMLDAELKRADMEALNLPWIDTIIDIPYPSGMNAKNLTSVAAHHEILNYFPHRAVFDALVMLKVLSRYDINAVVERSKQPTVEVIAHNLLFGRKDEAKERGYHWNPKRKEWFLTMKQCDADVEKNEAPFTTIVRAKKDGLV